MANIDNAEEYKPQRELRGWHVLLIFISFFALMFAVNGVFLYHAITSFPGEDIKKSYVQGLDYNRTLDARKAQNTLGWSASAGFEDGNLIFQLKDADGRLVRPHTVEAEIRRATTVRMDRTLELTRSASGAYIAKINDLDAGRWTIRFTVRSTADDQIRFQAIKTIMNTP